ncbi:hypothetical protein BOTBODRAFT_147211 [Botryobasidium botryosum FD-172 SS1]|uniref:Uncharacterized protein n=1 Tax=Botryobasidium botryosum (strain FD-172 SS1) TaxID=930990 RepID=A0A067MHY1_BOTB1|nr:hypothetical protein BOTBODRAFT_147211 [Botryobasidium botryosum FD-172 SS1]
MAPAHQSRANIELLQELTKQLALASNAVNSLEAKVRVEIRGIEKNAKEELEGVLEELRHANEGRERLERDNARLREMVKEQRAKAADLELQLSNIQQRQDSAAAETHNELKRLQNTLDLSGRIHEESIAQAQREVKEMKEQCARMESVRVMQAAQIQELLSALKGTVTPLSNRALRNATGDDANTSDSPSMARHPKSAKAAKAAYISAVAPASVSAPTSAEQEGGSPQTDDTESVKLEFVDEHDFHVDHPSEPTSSSLSDPTRIGTAGTTAGAESILGQGKRGRVYGRTQNLNLKHGRNDSQSLGYWSGSGSGERGEGEIEGQGEGEGGAESDPDEMMLWPSARDTSRRQAPPASLTPDPISEIPVKTTAIPRIRKGQKRKAVDRADAEVKTTKARR